MGRLFAAALRAAVPLLAPVLLSGCLDLLPTLKGEDNPDPIAERRAGAPPPMPGGLAAVRSRVAANALRNRDYGTAERLYREAHEAAPDSALPLVGVGETLYALGRFGEAIEAFRAATLRDHAPHEAREGLAKSLIANGGYAEAREILEAAIRDRPSPDALNKLGVARDLSGDGAGAEAAYRAALAQEPGNRSIRNNLALSLAISGRHGEAVSEMERVVAGGPDDSRYRGNLAFVYGLADDMAGVERVRGAVDQGERDRLQNRFAHIRALAQTGDRATVLALIDSVEGLRDGSGRPPPTPVPPSKVASAPHDISLKEKEEAPSPMARSPRPPAQVAVATPPAAPVAKASGPAAARGGWRVQLAAYRTQAHTTRGMDILLKKAGGLLPALEALVRRNADVGVAYRVRTPVMPDRATAAALCSTLQDRGIECLVIRHAADIWIPLG